MASARVMDLTGRAEALAVQATWSPPCEFLATLCAFGLPVDQFTLEVGPEWFENIRTNASTELIAGIERIGSGAGKVWVNLLGLAFTPSLAPDVPALIGRVQAMPALDLRLSLLGEHVPAYQATISREILREAAAGDRAAMNRLLADPAYFGGHAAESLQPLLSLGAEETKSAALDVLRRWNDEVFAHMDPSVAAALARDAEAKQAELRVQPAEEVVEAASGVQYAPEPGIRKVYLIPQFVMRPWVLLCEHDSLRLFCYPVADESLGGDAASPPGRLLRYHKALGDEKRLRMLRALATSGATLQELADRFSLPKSTAHHHLAILRAAGLVRVTSDSERRYSVRREVLPEAERLLDAYLERGQP